MPRFAHIPQRLVSQMGWHKKRGSAAMGVLIKSKPARLSTTPSALAMMLAACGGNAARFQAPPLNSAPQVGASTSQSFDEDARDQVIDIMVPSDPDNDPLTVDITAVPDNGRLFLASNAGESITTDSVISPALFSQLRFTADPGFDGDAGSFTYTVSDGRGGSAEQTIEFTINDKLSDTIAAGARGNTLVFLDLDGDLTRGANEAFIISDNNGRFATLSGPGTRVAIDGIDTFTGLRLDDLLISSDGGSVLSPLTTLLFYAPSDINVLALTRLQDEIDAAGGVDIFTFDAAARFDLLGPSLPDQVLQLNQEISIAVSVLRTLYRLTDTADPNAAAYQALAQSLLQTPQDKEIGLTLGADFGQAVVRDIALDLTGLPQFAASALDDIAAFVSGQIRSLIEFGFDILEADVLGALSPLRRAVVEEFTVNVVDILSDLDDASKFDDIAAAFVDARERLTLGIDEILARYITFDNIEFAPRFVPSGAQVTLQGTGMRDELNGHRGPDRLIGGAGDDHLRGGPGDDESFGGDGDDLIFDIDGNARADGGDGDDRLVVWQGEHPISGGDGLDTLDIDAALAALAMQNQAPDVNAGAATLEVTIDAATGQIRSQTSGESFFADAPLTGFERYVLPGDTDVTFLGSAADETLSIDLSRADGFGRLVYTASDGNDSVTSRTSEALGGAEDIIDLSQLSTAATFAAQAAPLITHAGGSLDITGLNAQFIGTNNGDIINTQSQDFFADTLAAGQDSITIRYSLGTAGDTIVLDTGGARLIAMGFDIAADMIDLSGVERMAGEAFTASNFAVALSLVDIDGSASTQLNYDTSTLVLEGITPAQVTEDILIFADT
ncbi:MAG: Ig-like domain-containing protein [Pseudomonadota bacterium]